MNLKFLFYLIAVQEASKAMIDAYASQTRAHLNINMDAPLIIIPISSKNHVTFLADLGKLHFSNAFVKEHENRIYDKIHFNLRDLQMHRVKIGKWFKILHNVQNSWKTFSHQKSKNNLKI